MITNYDMSLSCSFVHLRQKKENLSSVICPLIPKSR